MEKVQLFASDFVKSVHREDPLPIKEWAIRLIWGFMLGLNKMHTKDPLHCDSLEQPVATFDLNRFDDEIIAGELLNQEFGFPYTSSIDCAEYLQSSPTVLKMVKKFPVTVLAYGKEGLKVSEAINMITPCGGHETLAPQNNTHLIGGTVASEDKIYLDYPPLGGPKTKDGKSVPILVSLFELFLLKYHPEFRGRPLLRAVSTLWKESIPLFTISSTIARPLQDH